MTHTHFHNDPGHVMKKRAMSYERDSSGAYRISYIQNFGKIDAGGFYTNLDDLRKWTRTTTPGRWVARRCKSSFTPEAS